MKKELELEAPINDGGASTLIANLTSIREETNQQLDLRPNDEMPVELYNRTRSVLAVAAQSWYTSAEYAKRVGGQSNNVGDISNSDLSILLESLGAVNLRGVDGQINPNFVPIFDRFGGDNRSHVQQELLDIYSRVRILLVGVAIGRGMIFGENAQNALVIRAH